MFTIFFCLIFLFTRNKTILWMICLPHTSLMHSYYTESTKYLFVLLTNSMPSQLQIIIQSFYSTVLHDLWVYIIYLPKRRFLLFASCFRLYVSTISVYDYCTISPTLKYIMAIDFNDNNTHKWFFIDVGEML